MTKLTDTQVMRTPIVLCLFNRPDTTARVFSEIAKVKPQQLYVVADGPRPDHPNDVGDCAKTRAIIDRIDWDCQVHRNFSDSNLGCTQRMATGIEWAFTHVEEAIILEDDCLPDPTFFRYCGELLERYRDDPRVMQIAGFNVPQDRRTQAFSYYFSKFPTNWGWATWRRAWQHYDVGVAAWPSVRNTTWLLDIVGDRRVAAFWAHMLDLAHSHVLGTWDYQWLFACWQQRGWSIQPSVSMITNIGFGESATHTTSSCHDPRAEVLAAEMVFPLQHPVPLMENRKADKVYLRQAILQSGSDPSLGIWLQKKWWDLRNAHPSLKSWNTFWQRLAQKSLALFGQHKRRTLS